MATKELIQTVTVGSAGAATIDFINIPQGFTDLLIVASTRAGAGAVARNMNIRFNGSASGYSERMIDSNGSSASSANTSGSLVNWSLEADSGATASTFSNVSLYVPNYSLATWYKSMVIHSSSENNGTTGYNRMTNGLWANNSPINSVSLIAESGSSFVQYSSASLYGVRSGSDGIVNAPAIGGTVVTSGGYTYHVFTSSNTFIPSKPLTVDMVVVAGGGGGGGDGSGGGGGGGGGLVLSTQLVSTAQAVLIGAGGVGSTNAVNQTQGGYSQFGSVIAYGGGRGGQGQSAGGNGGSGGGAGGWQSLSGGTAVAGQGYAGGNGPGQVNNLFIGSGGGGASSAGTTATTSQNPNGGNGTWLPDWTAATSTGSSGSFAGGGGGGRANGVAVPSPGAGGTGGGGNGAAYPSTASAGVANTGGGGGGSGGNGGNGGSGIVIIRYPTPA